MAGNKKSTRKSANASVKRPASSKLTPSNDVSGVFEEIRSQTLPSTLDDTQSAPEYHGAYEPADSIKTFICKPDPSHNTMVFEDPAIFYDGTLQVQRTLPSTSKYGVAAAVSRSDGHNTGPSYPQQTITQSYTTPPANSAWTANALEYAASDTFDLIERWVYETSGSEITLAERLEKSNWEAHCASRL